MTTQRNISAELSEALSCIQDETLPPADAAARIISLCTKCVTDAAQDPPEPYDKSTPGLETFLWFFWEDVYREIIWDEPQLHSRLIEIMKHLKKQGRVGTEGWKFWGWDMDWDDLPAFGPVSRENFNGPSIHTGEGWQAPDYYDEACQGWLNVCRFVMQVWAAGVSDFELYALWMMREGLEDLDINRLEDTTDFEATGSLIPAALGVEEASLAVQIAGELMYRSKYIGGPNGNPDWNQTNAPGRGGKRWKGVDGYHPDRWKLWKSVFAEVAAAKVNGKVGETAVKAAQTALEVMEKIERQDMESTEQL